MKPASSLEPPSLQALQLAEAVESAAAAFAQAVEAYERHRLATDAEFRAAGGNSAAYSAPARIENTLFAILKAAGFSRFDRQIATASDSGLVSENGAVLRHFTLEHPACQAARTRADEFIKHEAESRAFRERRTPIDLKPGERFLGAVVQKPHG